MINPIHVDNAREWSLKLLREHGVDISVALKQPQAYKQLGERTIYDGEGRNLALTSLAGLLRNPGGLAVDVIQDVLKVVNTHRCGPPLEDKDVAEIAASIGRYERGSTTSQSSTASGVVELPLVSLGEMEEPGPRIEIVKGLIPDGHPTVLYGHGGQGKSFLGLCLGMCVAMGRPFVGREVIKGNVLYLDWELDEEEHARRAYQIIRGFGLKGMTRPPKNLWYHKASKPLPNLLPLIAQAIVKHDFRLLIIDSMGAACGGEPESARAVIPLLEELRNLGVASLVIDHQSKLQEGQSYGRKDPYGSVYKFNMARSVIQIEAMEQKRGLLVIGLEHKKSNFGPLEAKLGVELLFAEREVQFHAIDPAAHPAFAARRTMVDMIRQNLQEAGPATVQELVERLGFEAGTVGNAVSRMKRAGQLIDIEKKGHASVLGLPNAPKEPE